MKTDIYKMVEDREPSCYGDIELLIKNFAASQADKILSRLAVIFTDYKNAGFKNSAMVTKNIMLEIEQLTGVRGPIEEVHAQIPSDNV